MGGREVSRESFRHALRGRRSCLVVPGGQAEMLQSQSNDLEVCHFQLTSMKLDVCTKFEMLMHTYTIALDLDLCSSIF